MPLPEKQIIARIRRLVGSSRKIATGIGDDCAVLRPPRNSDLLVTTDLSLEGTHFRREWHPAESVGHRCLARGLSDVAAMAGDPLAAFLSLAVPSDLPQKWADEFLRGFMKLGKRFDCPLAGGDIAESKHGIIADVMVVGSVPRNRAVLRSGARLGDNIYVTGSLGGSATTLRRLFAGENLRATQRHRHFYPGPRIAIAQWLRERKLPTSMIDLSDGLSTDLAHLCDQSRVRAVINETLLPISRGASVDQALHGGEDYELLFTARAGAKIPPNIAGVPVTEIGWIEKGSGVFITNLKKKPRQLLARGWEHFSESTR